MKRYFYPASRSHHALCMAVDHGFRFIKANGEFWSHEGIAAINTTINYKFVLSNDTLDRLKPRTGDIGDDGEIFDGTTQRWQVDGCAFPENYPAQIVFRHHRPWMAPDCEEA